MADDEKRETEDDEPSAVQQVNGRGPVRSKPASTTVAAPDSALGDKSATPSGAEPQPNPAEERSE